VFYRVFVILENPRFHLYNELYNEFPSGTLLRHENAPPDYGRWGKASPEP